MAKKDAGAVREPVGGGVDQPTARGFRKALPGLAIAGVVGIPLGVMAAWPIEDTADLYRTVLFCAVLLATLGVFFLVFPRWFTLPIQIFIAMVAGVLAGWLLDTAGHEAFVVGYLGIFGTLFILLLKMIVIPLVFTSIVSGLADIGDFSRIGRLGAKTFAYYLGAAMVATLIGLLVVNIIRPGAGKSGLIENLHAQTAAAEKEITFGQRIQKEFLPSIVPSPDSTRIPVLPIIFSAIVLGLTLAANGARSGPAIALFASLNEAIMIGVGWIMYLAPVAVFALMAVAVAQLGVEYLQTLAKYVVTVLLGLTVHFCFLTFVLLPLLGRYSPRRFLRAMAPALELGFSTSSSSATLPVSLECLIARVGVDRTIANFMLPLGATVNMNGTALYQAVAAVFIAQVYGIPLPFFAQLLIFLTAILVSIGTAGIPGASVGLMVLTLGSAGIPAEGIGLILGVDRFLDMSRTVVNVLDDSVCATVVARSENAITAPPALT